EVPPGFQEGRDQAVGLAVLDGCAEAACPEAEGGDFQVGVAEAVSFHECFPLLAAFIRYVRNARSDSLSGGEDWLATTIMAVLASGCCSSHCRLCSAWRCGSATRCGRTRAPRSPSCRCGRG